MKYEEVKLYNPGILIADTPQDIFSELLESCNKQIESKDVAKRLRRNSMKDYGTQGLEEILSANLTSNYQKFLLDFSVEYMKYFSVKGRNPQILHAWLNLQKKYEYRPAHHHSDGSGLMLGYVTYIKVPYDLTVEDEYPNHNNKAAIHRNGRIEFFYNLLSGMQFTERLHIDKSFEGKTILFLNNLMHSVYPFYTSDDYRISLAGSIII